MYRTIPIPKELDGADIQAVMFFGVIEGVGIMPFAVSNGPFEQLDPNLVIMLKRICKNIMTNAEFDESPVVNVIDNLFKRPTPESNE